MASNREGSWSLWASKNKENPIGLAPYACETPGRKPTDLSIRKYDKFKEKETIACINEYKVSHKGRIRGIARNISIMPSNMRSDIRKESKGTLGNSVSSEPIKMNAQIQWRNQQAGYPRILSVEGFASRTTTRNMRIMTKAMEGLCSWRRPLEGI